MDNSGHKLQNCVSNNQDIQIVLAGLRQKVGVVIIGLGLFKTESRAKTNYFFMSL